MTFYMQKAKHHLHCDIIMFCTNKFLATIQWFNSGTEGEIVMDHQTSLNTHVNMLCMLSIAHETIVMTLMHIDIFKLYYKGKVL